MFVLFLLPLQLVPNNSLFGLKEYILQILFFFWQYHLSDKIEQESSCHYLTVKMYGETKPY